MCVEVKIALEDERARWDDIIEESPHGQFFHQYEALTVQAFHAEAKLHPLIGFKGQEPVGVFPIFAKEKGPFTAAFSPSPLLGVPALGPALVNMDKMKRRKAERRHKRFINGCFDWINSELCAQYIYVRTDYRYDDVRPFQWNGCTVAPLFSYLVDLRGGQETVKMRFSSDLRSNIREKDDLSTDFNIEVGHVQEAEQILKRVHERLNSLDVISQIPTSFGADLLTRLPEGQVKPYVCRVNGKIVGGMLIIEYDDIVYRWLGGNKPPDDVDIPVNDLLDWRIMTDAMNKDISTYDLVGADNPRTNRYKSKFNPEIETYYRVEGGSWLGRRLVQLYKQRHKIPKPLLD